MLLAEAEQLSYKLGNRYILKDIDFRIEKNENWIILGLNGSGKTTLLSLLSGYLPSPAESIARYAKAELVSDAFFANYYRNETALDIVLSGYTKSLGIRKKITNAEIIRAKKLFRLFLISEKSRKPFYALSKGERQKVLLIRAFVSKPELIFLDEPFSGLDVYARNYTMRVLRYIAEKERISLVCVTHYFDEITDLYNKALLLKDGKIHSKGDLREIITTSNISDFFGKKARIIYTDGGIELKMDEEDLFDKSLLD